MTTEEQQLEQIRLAIGERLRRVIGDDPLPLYEMVRYHLGLIDLEGRPATGAGKGLRPIFCCLAAEAAGGDWRRAVAAAAAIELTHNFTLVHDDIEDGDLERRHRPTVWARWGLAQGINTGDAVWVLAWQALTEATADGLPAETLAECARRLAATCRELTEGQYRDLALEGEAETDLDGYLRIVNAKTGALLACAFEVGALCGGAGAGLAAEYGHAGRLLGVAFQMQDDVLGSWGDPSDTGKPAGGDIRRKKMSLPAVYALQTLEGEARTTLRSLYRTEGLLSDAQVEGVFGLFEESGIRTAVDELARSYADRVQETLERLPMQGGAGQVLLALSASLAGRRV